MTDNASLYLTDPTPIPLDYLQRVAPSAQVSFLPPSNGTAGGYLLAAPTWRLVMNVLPADQVPGHLNGFAGYVVHVTGGGATPAAQAVLQRVSATRLVLGCVVEPGFDPAGEIRRALAAVASGGRGLVFAHNALYDAGGALLVGPAGAPPGFLPAVAATGRTPAQQWILATAAILTEINEGDPTLLGGWLRPTGTEHATACLRSYDVRAPKDVADKLQWLHAEGHRVELGKRTGLDPRTYLAWDLGRLASVAGWGYLAYHLDAETAWRWMTAAAVQIRQAFPGWQAFGESYALGRSLWMKGVKEAAKDAAAADDDDDHDADEAPRVVGKLLGAGGLWSQLPWDVPLDGASVPVDAQRVHRVGAGGFPTLAAALEQAADGDRVVVAPGTYREALTFARSVEVAAAPGGPVVVEARGDRVIHVEDVGVSLEGLLLRAAGKDADGEGVDAVWAVSGFLRMVGCDVQGERHGVDLCTGASEVTMSQCVVHDCGGAGVLAEGGYFTAMEVELRGNAVLGTQIAGEADAAMLGCRVHDCGGAGIQVAEEAEALVRGCEVWANVGSAVNVMRKGRLKLEDTRLHDGKGAGLVVADEGSAVVQRCELRDHAFSGVEVRGAKELWMLECKVLGGAERGVWCHAEGAVRMEACEIRGSVGACVVAESAEVIMNACTLGDSVEGGGLWVSARGRAKLLKCTIEGGAIVAVEVQGEGTFAELSGCAVRGAKGEGAFVHEKARSQWTQCTVTGVGSTGLRIDEGAEVVIQGCLVEGAAGSALVVRDGANANVVKTAFRGCAVWGIEVGERGKTHVVDCVVERNKEGGVFVTPGGAFRMEGGEVAHQLDEGVRIASQEAELVGTRVHHNKGVGVYVGENARARLEGCEVAENGGDGAQSSDAGEMHLVGCRVLRNGEDDVFVYDGGRAMVEGCEVGGGGGRAVMAEGGSQIVLRRTQVVPGAKGEVVHDETSRVVRE